ncbi:MAG TPA: hypothetical protein VGH49_07225 [Xanthobacteraceae bacterium]
MSDEPVALSASAAPPPTEADYDAIFAAVMETVRGRWFLGEFAKRNRNADSELILAAIDRLAPVLHERHETSPADRVRFDLLEMAKAIAHTKSEIAAIRPEDDTKGTLVEATEELGSIVQTTEQATSAILAAAERVQEIAWTLRERGTDSEACDALDQRATDIYSACSFQDLTGQRTRKVVEVMRFLEDRIKAMIDIWDATGPPTPSGDAAHPPRIDDAHAAGHLGQPDIDQIMPAGMSAAAASDEAESFDGRHDDDDGDDAAIHEADTSGVDTFERIATGRAAADHDGGAAPSAFAMAAPYVRPPGVAASATAVAFQPAPAATLREAEQAPVPTLSEARTDPAAVLSRILAIIEVPADEPSSGESGLSDDASALPQPQVERLRTDVVTPLFPAPAVEAAAETAVPAEPIVAPAPEPAVAAAAADQAAQDGDIAHASDQELPIPLQGPVSVAEAVDAMLNRVPVRVQYAPTGRSSAPPPAATAAAKAARTEPARTEPVRAQEPVRSEHPVSAEGPAPAEDTVPADETVRAEEAAPAAEPETAVVSAMPDVPAQAPARSSVFDLPMPPIEIGRDISPEPEPEAAEAEPATTAPEAVALTEAPAILLALPATEPQAAPDKTGADALPPPQAAIAEAAWSEPAEIPRADVVDAMSEPHSHVPEPEAVEAAAGYEAEVVALPEPQTALSESASDELPAALPEAEAIAPPEPQTALSESASDEPPAALPEAEVIALPEPELTPLAPTADEAETAPTESVAESEPEPAPGVLAAEPPIAAPAETPAAEPPRIAALAAAPAPEARVVAPPPPRSPAIARTDVLAAVTALSEEEKIALFS